ncbi:MAG: squalene--hopene cyclase [Elusimicrobia bacterium]|nr:squalene--hopene cyclase [Elusimicrobiota bacterium]
MPPLSEELQESVSKAQQALLKKQNFEDGYWCADLRADTTLESDYIMLLNFMGQGQSPKIQKLARFILSEQLADGGWPIYRKGPAELSATVKAYWALKFAGHHMDESPMRLARKKIWELGGIHRVNTYQKLYMALFGQYGWEGVPAIPPEMMLFPKWFYFNIYEMSSWTRAIVIPLSVLWAKRPFRECPPHATLDELFPDERRFVPIREVMPKPSFFSWQNFFLLWDSGLKSLEGRGPHILRLWSLKLVERYILNHIKNSAGMGAIFPAIINTIMALKALGTHDRDSAVRHQIKHLEELEIDGETILEMQPCFSPIWDTAIAIIALAESGLYRDHPALQQAALWLLSKEVKSAGDWRVKNPDGTIGGWYFQFENEWNPDTDDTAMAILALRHIHLEEPYATSREKAALRGVRWILSMQCPNGGWGAFDKNSTKWIFTKIPFADHNAMIDSPSADITARILELLGHIGYDASYPFIRSAIDFLKQNQESDGSWYGRWGVNYLYGTWQVLRGLAAIGEAGDQPYIQRAADWLKSVQHPDGGWGETCATYEDPSTKGKGPSTPSQTAWALMGLLAAGTIPHPAVPGETSGGRMGSPGTAGTVNDPAVKKGVEYLLSTQKADGTWEETDFTGTGFPKVFYLEYTLYRDYFPLMALGNYQKALASITEFKESLILSTQHSALST